jgi:peptidoglycan/LPS O-acetylase OafA/YrhL
VYAPDTRAKDILAGCLLALLLDRLPAWVFHRRLVVAALVVLGMWALVVPKGWLLYMAGWPIVIGAAVILIGSLTRDLDWAVPRALATSPMVWLGQRSYGIYLWNAPLTVINSDITSWSRETKVVVALATTGTAVALAALSMRYVESRFRPLRPSAGAPAGAPAGDQER